MLRWPSLFLNKYVNNETLYIDKVLLFRWKKQDTKTGIYSNHKSTEEIARRIKAYNIKADDREERVGAF